MRHFKLGLVLIISTWAGIAFAQPTINSQTVFNPGESVTIRFGEGFFEPGPSGQDVNWDFSSVGHNKEWDWKFYNPQETMFIDSFPEANMAFKFPQGDTADIWEYYLFRNDSLSWLGAASVLGADSSVFYQMLNENPDVRMIFPITYQNSFDDNLRGVNWIRYAGSLIKQSRSGDITHTADAYGSLTTPYGTFQNVLRIKTTETIYDTLQAFIPVPSEQKITRYTWYSSDERYILMHMDSIAVIQFGFPASLTKSHMYRAGEIMTSIDQDKLAKEMELSVFPNPASDVLNVNFNLDNPQNVKISLGNIIGQNLISKVSSQLYSGEQTHQLDLSELGAGYYLLTIETDRGMAAKKVRVY